MVSSGTSDFLIVCYINFGTLSLYRDKVFLVLKTRRK